MTEAPDPRTAAERRRALVGAAAWAAFGRIADAGADRDAVFAPLGEALFWIDAERDVRSRLSREGYEHYQERIADRVLLDALSYARNLVTHDARPYEHTLEDVHADTYTDLYGAWCWSPIGSPDERAAEYPWTLTRKDGAQQRKGRAYAVCLGDPRAPILDTLREALLALGYSDAYDEPTA